ncbi:MAG: DUF1634 domain-containing protein [Pedobacter sp.]|nr:MAG: DUF1634 domain-containing protein [Pedobacter sp.]
MIKEKHHTSDKDIQIILGNLLRIGVISSMVIVLTGGVVYLFEQRGVVADYGTFRPALSDYSSILSILKGLMSFKSTAIIQFGILLLIFTPIMRIVFSIYNFIMERDHLYVIIGIIVLTIILVSLNGGFAG